LAKAGFSQFFFVDNSFNIPEQHALDLCKELARLQPQIRWRCIMYPQGVSEHLVAQMAKTGCCEVSLGFESGCLRILREMHKRYAPHEVREASELLRRHGIRRFGFLLLGGPGETRESVEESLALATSLNLDALRVTVGIRIYPGTILARKALDEGKIQSEADLLIPRFYLADGLEPWIRTRVAAML
jgi:radical SAM superfamily enzyme YgiQ (UPF0313 family)